MEQEAGRKHRSRFKI